MTAPRVEIDLAKIHHNARTLVGLLSPLGISVTGVTKASLGSPEIAGELLRAGVTALGDSRIENLESMRNAGVRAPLTLIRSPMLSQVEQIVTTADVSFNTEVEVISRLSWTAGKKRRRHGIVLMVELGDLREGIMPGDLEAVVRQVLCFPNIDLVGIGANLACQNGVVPDRTNMAELSALADSIEATFGIGLEVVSGGNSGNLRWALSGADTGRINDLRLGESILLGREPLERQPIPGLHTDAFTLVAEVIESGPKPSQPWGDVAQTAFGEPRVGTDRGDVAQAILAIGHQDTDPDGIEPPAGISIMGASSDHLVVDPGQGHLRIGDEVPFQLDYSALLRSMTSPFVEKVLTPVDTPVLASHRIGIRR